MPERLRSFISNTMNIMSELWIEAKKEIELSLGKLTRPLGCYLKCSVQSIRKKKLNKWHLRLLLLLKTLKKRRRSICHITFFPLMLLVLHSPSCNLRRSKQLCLL